MINEQIRNVAIIAHVDHGKTTLVDEMLKQGGAIRGNQQIPDRVMDANALERERGITILAKNTSVHYGEHTINVVDTPGHADFGGEVERILKMVNGAVLVVDSLEGTMPQTRFVLSKALSLGLSIVVVVNKMDRQDARPKEVVDEVLELFMDLGATDEQLDSPFVFASARHGISSLSYDKPGNDLSALFGTIIKHIPAPEGDENGPAQLLVSARDYSEYVGSMGIGRVERGSFSVGQQVVLVNFHDTHPPVKAKLNALYKFDGLSKVPAETAIVGEIVCVSGVEGVNIGDTVCSPEVPEAIEFPKISEPSVEMAFLVNDSPFAGREGKYVTSRHLRDRLYREAGKDVSLRVSDGSSADTFMVCGRGEMHLSILIENMRREGYEFQVSMPRVLYKEGENGEKTEPIDKLIVDVPETAVGAVIEKMGVRRGELENMQVKGDRMELTFLVPTRGLFGYKSEFLTDTKGEGILNTLFEKYDMYKGDIRRRASGSLIAFETGEAVTYGLYNAQERGPLFINPGQAVYAGMIVGECPKGDDIQVNVCKRKQMTNMRSSSSDEALRLTPPKNLSLEQSLEFLADDELLEITPKNIRIRKIQLDSRVRLRQASKAKGL